MESIQLVLVRGHLKLSSIYSYMNKICGTVQLAPVYLRANSGKEKLNYFGRFLVLCAILQLYGSLPPEPVWVINNRRRHLGYSVDPYYAPGPYAEAQNFGPYSRGPLVSVRLHLNPLCSCGLTPVTCCCRSVVFGRLCKDSNLRRRIWNRYHRISNLTFLVVVGSAYYWHGRRVRGYVILRFFKVKTLLRWCAGRATEDSHLPHGGCCQNQGCPRHRR